jgi:hypothetical protein
MAKFCSECGAALAANARFCSECGAGIAGVANATSVAAAPTPAAIAPISPAGFGQRDSRVDNGPTQGTEYAFSQPVEESYDEETPKRRGLIWAGVAVIALAVAGGAWVGFSTIGAEDQSGTSASEKPSAAQPVREEYYALAKANVRDKPTLNGSRVVGSFERGEKVSGTTEAEAGGRIWLKLDNGGGYVSLANLSKVEPPVLTTVDGSDRIVRGSCSLLEKPAAGSSIKTSLKKGVEVKNFGKTANGFAEFGLPGGGVGYAAPNAECVTNQSMAKGAVANQLIKFDPNNCEFGPELDSYFEKAQKLRASDPEGYEMEELTVPVDKLFHGLRVTAAISGYEWHGVAFADSVDKVRSVFRRLGYAMDEQGEFIVDAETPVVSNLSATTAETAKRGKSQLLCGV